MIDKAINVLLVEDDEDDYFLVRDLLDDVREQQFNLDWVSTFEQAAQKIEQQRHDVYLVDYRLGEHNGIELLKMVQQKQYHAPVIILSGQGDRELDIAALRSGAADYLDKSYLQSSLLEHYIRASIERNRALQALRESEQKYRQLFEQENLVREELARSNTALEDFAYVASHDLQEPLRAISGYTQLLDSEYADQFDAAAAEYMSFILSGTQRMQNLIQDLLTYSRAGRDSRTFSLIDCREAVEAAMGNLQPMIQQSEATITIGSLPNLIADGSQIVQLFQNLLSNAIKFRRAVPLQIQIQATETGQQRWLFSISDNGIGIDPKYFDRIFKIFKRLHTQREFPGTGVGLALCQKIVEQHDGKIWLNSEPGVGTTFYFTLAQTPTRATFSEDLSLSTPSNRDD